MKLTPECCKKLAQAQVVEDSYEPPLPTKTEYEPSFLWVDADDKPTWLSGIDEELWEILSNIKSRK